MFVEKTSAYKKLRIKNYLEKRDIRRKIVYNNEVVGVL